jgi:hypothetical protein
MNRANFCCDRWQNRITLPSTRGLSLAFDSSTADRTRGPDVFPADAIVAVDVSFMSHSTWNAIQERARAAGAWRYWAKHGSATLSRATAAAWMAHRARK